MARWWILGGLLGLVLLRLAMRPLLALVFGREIGRRALARVPATVHLSRRGDEAWKDPDHARRIWEPLLAHGFADAGSYGVDEMPGVVMRLLASTAASMLAVVYEHPRSGQWLELVTYYTDGRRCSASNLASPGVETPPFVIMLRAVGAPPLKLLDLMRHKRPEGAMTPLAAADATRLYERAYAESMAWHQQHGIGTGEVVRVAIKRRAA